MNLIERIIAPDNLQAAWTWLESRRKDSHYNNDYWHLRHYRQRLEAQIIQQLCAGTYCFSPCKQHSGTLMWSAQDSLVLKAMSMVLTDYLSPKLSASCFHLAGHGGAKGCVNAVSKKVEQYRFVCRSDVNSYYATIDHGMLETHVTHDA